jgi:hypothetical protein
MKARFKRKIILFLGVAVSGAVLTWICSAPSLVFAQQPTVAVPTVTGTPPGPIAFVNQDQEMINVHNGPGPNYPVIGILVAGEQAPALGISGEWIEIIYWGTPDNSGWVLKSLVSLKGVPPEITPQPTPISKVTPTLNPTLAANYAVTVVPTILPTFTPPGPLAVPNFSPANIRISTQNLPIGFVIIGLAVIGLFGTLISLLRGR